MLARFNLLGYDVSIYIDDVVADLVIVKALVDDLARCRPGTRQIDFRGECSNREGTEAAANFIKASWFIKPISSSIETRGFGKVYLMLGRSCPVTFPECKPRPVSWTPNSQPAR
jgi:hypothetical protein